MDQAAMISDINQRLGALGETVKTLAESVHTTATELGPVKGLACALAGEPATEDQNEDVVDPWTVESASEKGVDYDRLISKFHFIFLYNCVILSFFFQYVIGYNCS